MRSVIGIFLAAVLLTPVAQVLAGEKVEIVVEKVEVREPAEAEGPELIELDLGGLAEALREQIAEIEALRSEMQTALEAIEKVDAQVAKLREKRLEERLDAIADLGPEMKAAVEKLRQLRTRADELRADLAETKAAQREAFGALEISREDKDLLRELMSDQELPFIPPERRTVEVRREDDRRGRGGSPMAARLRENSERRREERQRRLAELELGDPELYALMKKKVELLDALDEPRVALAEHMEMIQAALRALNERLADVYRSMEPGPDF